MIERDAYVERYLEQYRDGTFETILVEVRRRRVLEAMQNYPHRAVLEVGCGVEPTFLRCDGYDRYVVVEPAETFAQRAESLAERRPGVEVVQGYLEEVAGRIAADGDFDFIVLSSLLHEVPDPERLLRAAGSVCAPGGVVHVNVPNVRSFHRLL